MLRMVNDHGQLETIMVKVVGLEPASNDTNMVFTGPGLTRVGVEPPHLL